ncbi:energy-coupling factor transporter transmembrane protein EcfT [Nocardia otitidiscaviarum]|uniref:energy-coupling factor transporter transmembrane component T family protein n=1 Tax=Nocardia otitidiscaviarum TaxID=1823 RepID=UPI0004A762AE|nr:energy-coupling factor transporter transmembrane protein EcfT [Nocardia otitidiscaviarum]MBF6132420.1 energy-coupling factor transporter transmembrane protein EcfT [Nocardia otitidiscaviarum]MBF6483512.1 energy-coupling factor transporter transmembrane protein EcfT [Nocardia otitidiscaviarum]
MLSLYHDARTPVHAVPAGAKLIVLATTGTALFFVSSPVWLAVALGVVLALYALARIPWRATGRQVLAIAPFLVLIAIAQLMFTGWVSAVLVSERILALVLLANLVTLTTRTSAMIDTIERALGPLRPLGVRPERVGLLVAMTIRFIPVIREQAELVRAAQRARGIECSTAFLIPLLIRTLRMADNLGEALDARGLQ